MQASMSRSYFIRPVIPVLIFVLTLLLAAGPGLAQISGGAATRGAAKAWMTWAKSSTTPSARCGTSPPRVICIFIKAISAPLTAASSSSISSRCSLSPLNGKTGPSFPGRLSPYCQILISAASISTSPSSTKQRQSRLGPHYQPGDIALVTLLLPRYPGDDLRVRTHLCLPHRRHL